MPSQRRMQRACRKAAALSTDQTLGVLSGDR